MKIGYARVSTAEQNIARQIMYLKNIGITDDAIFIDKISGKDLKRPQLEKMLAFIRKGDTLYVESLSRLARSIRDLLAIIDMLKDKGVEFVSQKENFDTSTPQGRLVLTIFAALSEFERELLLQRQAEGIIVAKQEGKYKGRKPIQIDEKKFKVEYDKWKAGKQTAKETMLRLGLKPNTFYKWVKVFDAALLAQQQ